MESSGGNGVSEGSSTDQQQEEQSSEEAELKRENGRVICKALMLVSQMHGSFNDFVDVLTFAKDLFSVMTTITLL